MTTSSRLIAFTSLLLLSLGTTAVAQVRYDDPSGRVARLNDSRGEISYSPAGEDDWIEMERNRPIIRGDRLWTDHDARAEFQVGNAALRLGPDTSFEVLNLNDDVAQMRLAQGTVNLRIRRMYPGQYYEIATPLLSFTVTRAGRYRIDVDPYDEITTIVVWEGAGEVYGDDGHFSLRAGDTVRFYDQDLRDHEMYGLPRLDDFDRYSLDRDQRLDRSASLRYVDDDTVGYSDLDEYGDWQQVRDLGVVWFPRQVDNDWAPYRDGHWAWQEPWGWTWIDDARWGFAPSHYGRWVHTSDRWGWIPGPRNRRSVYSPAMVVFIGGGGWGESGSSRGSSPIGWFPLGYREPYIPSYRASRDYFTRVNVNNTVINNTTITNVYNNYSSGDINIRQVNYVNRRVPGAVTAVPTNVFVNAQSVRAARIRLDSRAAESGAATRVAAIVPVKRSVLGSGKTARIRPTREAVERTVVARRVPPPAKRPFTAREEQLKRTPGRAPEVAVTETAPTREVAARRKVKVLDEKRSAAADVRTAGPRPAAGKPAAPGASASPQLKTLDRSAKPGQGRGRDRSRDESDSETPAASTGQSQPNERQRAERQRQAETQQQEQRDRQAATQLQRGQGQGLAESQSQRDCVAAAMLASRDLRQSRPDRDDREAEQAARDSCRDKPKPADQRVPATPNSGP